jgi:hypothetical protein
VKGRESNGVSSNYDHFIISEEDESACNSGEVVNFINNKFSETIKNKYLIRREAPGGPYAKLAAANQLIERREREIEKILLLNNFVFSKSGAFSVDQKAMDRDLSNFSERVLLSQLKDETYYKYMVQIMSDHLPIKLECQF